MTEEQRQRRMECNRQRQRRYRLAHPLKRREWDKTHPGRQEASEQRYRNRHPEKQREWYKKNREHVLAQQREWRKANPAVEKAIMHRRRARRHAASGDGLTTRQWQELVASYCGLCAYCSRPSQPTLDHIEPLSKGGAHDLTNSAPICASCNGSKGKKQLLVWLAGRAA